MHIKTSRNSFQTFVIWKQKEINFISTVLIAIQKKKLSWFCLPSIESWALALPLVPTTFLAKHWYFASSSSSSWVMTRDPSTSMDILKRMMDQSWIKSTEMHSFIDDKLPLYPRVIGVNVTKFSRFLVMQFPFFQDLRFLHLLYTLEDFCTSIENSTTVLCFSCTKVLRKEIKVISNQLDRDKGVKYANWEGIEKRATF